MGNNVTILLTSEKAVKELTGISENVSGNIILAALREAQEVHLKTILGPSLLSRLKDLVNSGDISKPENANYKELIEQCKYYLIYATVVELCVNTTYKITNFGVTTTDDEKLKAASLDEVFRLRDYWQAKVDYHCIELQTYVWNNRASFKELCDNDCERIHANLFSAATCGVFLGGPRGKGLYPKCINRR